MLTAIQYLLVLVFPVLVVAAALRDLTSYIIPNWLSLALVAAFLPAALASGLSPQQIGLCAAAGAGGLVAGMVMFALGWIGGGDAKLFAASALWIGWPACLTYAAYTGIAGGVLAVALLSLRSAMVKPYLPAGPRWFGRLTEPGEGVPYGVAIAAGALAAFPSSALGSALAVSWLSF
jgi:prepilin peptidase CpaA